MTTVLITRPHFSARELAQDIEKEGYKTILAPLLDIIPTHIPFPSRVDAHATIITSGNALNSPLDDNLRILFKRPCFCVGTRTAEKAHAYGFENIYDAAGDGHQLARLVHKILGDTQNQILHIAGGNIASAAHDDLKALGYNLHIWPVYKAEPIVTLSQETTRALQANTCDIAMVFSVRTAETLCHLLKTAKLSNCCQRLTVIGLSNAVLAALAPLPWKQSIAATMPTEHAMIACLKTICPASEAT